jgi:hypothetical protein
MTTEHFELTHFSGSLHPFWECYAPVAAPPGATLTIKHLLLPQPSKLKHVKYVTAYYVKRHAVYSSQMFHLSTMPFSQVFFIEVCKSFDSYIHIWVRISALGAQEWKRCATLWTWKRRKFSFLNTGTGGIATPFLTSTLNGREWSASRSCYFTSGGTVRGNHLIGGCMGPKVGLFVMEKRKISCPCRESNSESSVLQPVVRRYTDWAIPAPPLRPHVTCTTSICHPPTSQFITIVTSLSTLNNVPSLYTLFMLCCRLQYSAV